MTTERWKTDGWVRARRTRLQRRRVRQAWFDCAHHGHRRRVAALQKRKRSAVVDRRNSRNRRGVSPHICNSAKRSQFSGVLNGVD